MFSNPFGAVSMANISVNLSEELQHFVNCQVEIGQYDGASSYIEALVARAKEGKERLEALLIEGLDSGEPMPLDADEWRRIRETIWRSIECAEARSKSSACSTAPAIWTRR
jgi:antitoxin ParD1/3/4